LSEKKLTSKVPEFLRKQVWPLDLSKQYKEDVKDVAFKRGLRIVDSNKVTKGFQDHIKSLVDAGICAGICPKDKLPKVTVVPPKHSIGKKETKADLLNRALDTIEDMRAEIEALKADKK